MELQRYWQVIQKKVCPRCLDGDGHGACRLPVGEECALKSFLPQVVMTVADIKSNSIETHIDALRRQVCTLCEHQSPDMVCSKRSHLECALDRYYPLVVEIIELVRDEMASTASSEHA